MRILGVDPGAAHVGVSDWTGTTCNWAAEWTPTELARGVLEDNLLAGYNRIFAEDFISSGGFGSARTGADTSELLGMLVWTARVVWAVEVERVTRYDRAAARKRLVGYKKYRRASMGHGDHALDAEAIVLAGMGWSVTELARPE